MQAATMMMALGYTEVVDMQGGYDAEMDARGNVVVEGWARRNFPTTTDYTPQSKVIAVIGLAFVTLSKRPNCSGIGYPEMEAQARRSFHESSAVNSTRQGLKRWIFG